MKKGKCLIFGLLPLTASAALPSASAQRNGSVSEQTKVESVSDVFKVGEEGRVEALAIMNSDPGGVIAVLEQLTGRTALVDSKLPKVKISIGIREPISVPEAIVAIESVLNLNGIATVDMGDKFIKVVPAKSAITQAPAILNESLRSYVPNQNVYSQIITFRYLDAAEFQKRVKSLLTPGLSNSVVFPELNAVLFTDVMSNLQTVEELSQRMDKPVTMVEAVNFLPLVNIKASAVSKKLEQLKRGALKKYLSNTTIDCDDSSNQLIVITPQENFHIIADIARQLDNKCELLLRSEVIRIKHGDSKKITDIVSGIIKEQRSRIEKENKMAFERQQAQMSAQGNLASALAQAASGSRSNQQISNTYSDFISSQQLPGGELGEEQTAQFSGNLTLSSDERSNLIIVYGTASDLSQVRNLIANLDVLLDQVRIEVIVAQITLNEGQQSGMDALNLGYNQGESYGQYKGSKTIPAKDGGAPGTHEYKPVAYDVNFSGGFGESSSSGAFTGTLKNFALSTLFKKAKTDSNIKILSTPNLVTTHNRKANFKIGEERPFVDSSTQKDDKDAKERVNIIDKHVGLELTVMPLIGSNGIIQMEIEQKISKYDGDAAAGSVQAPIISDKQINSFISVANGDVIVLAGFKEKENSKSGGKLFLLGDIPILGDTLFTSRKRDEKVKELIVFIKPTIILHPQEEAAYLDKRLEVTNFKEDITCYKETGDFPKNEPFLRDTIFGLNGQEMLNGRKKAGKNKQNATIRRNSSSGENIRRTSSVPAEPEISAAAGSDTWNELMVQPEEEKKKSGVTGRNRRSRRNAGTPKTSAAAGSDTRNELAVQSEEGKGKSEATGRNRRSRRNAGTPKTSAAEKLPSGGGDLSAKIPRKVSDGVTGPLARKNRFSKRC